MKSSKYKIHRISKRAYPTQIVMNSTSKGMLIYGAKAARQECEKRLNRKLHTDTKFKSGRFEWMFKEPLKNGTD